MDSVADISGVHATSIFRVEPSNMIEFLYIRNGFCCSQLMGYEISDPRPLGMKEGQKISNSSLLDITPSYSIPFLTLLPPYPYRSLPSCSVLDPTTAFHATEPRAENNGTSFVVSTWLNAWGSRCHWFYMHSAALEGAV
jgi:hypothetical protein